LAIPFHVGSELLSEKEVLSNQRGSLPDQAATEVEAFGKKFETNCEQPEGKQQASRSHGSCILLPGLRYEDPKSPNHVENRSATPAKG
jgi:hypothetical protein